MKLNAAIISSFALAALLGCSEVAVDHHKLGVEAYQAKNFAEAAKHLSVSAGQGDPDSQAILGSMYILGQGVTQDRKRAEELLLAPANNGHPHAELFLGILYFSSDNAEDLAKAKHWLEKSAAAGEPKAIDLLTRLPK